MLIIQFLGQVFSLPFFNSLSLLSFGASHTYSELREGDSFKPTGFEYAYSLFFYLLSIISSLMEC